MKHETYNMKHKSRGFTLMELIIAMAIFIVVISVVVSLFMTGLKGQRKVIALQNVQDNTRYLLEFMAKEIRMSDIDSTTSTTLDITRPDGESVSYLFNNAQQRIERTDSSSSGPINSEEVSVTGNFYSMGIGKGDGQQPRITIVMQVETSGKAEERAKISLQITLSPRNLDL